MRRLTRRGAVTLAAAAALALPGIAACDRGEFPEAAEQVVEPDEDPVRQGGDAAFRRGDTEIDAPYVAPGSGSVAELVRQGLAEHEALSTSGVRIEVVEGTVVLTGEVPSAGAKRAAEEIADGVRGVEGVRNLLVVAQGD